MNLPQELIDKIIDQVWDAGDPISHAATKTASLVSRAWVNRSQRYLFHTVRLSEVGNWCNAVTPGPNGVSRHVRSLTIEATWTAGWFADMVTLERALPHFESFCNLRTLRILHWDVTLLPPEALARCFTPFAEGIRLLHWEPHYHATYEACPDIVGMFPHVNCLLVSPKLYREVQLLPTTPTGIHRKKLIFSGNRAANLVMRCNTRFQEIHMRCDSDTTLETVIAVISGHADRLEVLTILGVSEVIDASTAGVLASALGGCHVLRELSLDWTPVYKAQEPHLIDAIPGDRVPLLRIMPCQIVWGHQWRGDLPASATVWLKTTHERLAQAVRRLGLRFSAKNRGEKISVRFVIPRVPYVMRDPIRLSVIAFWEVVEDAVSFEFEMTEAEPQNVDERRLIYRLEA